MTGLGGLVLLVAAGALALAPVAGAQEPTGKVRLGHLSPKTPGVDITLSGPEGPTSVDQRVGSGVAYGAVTDYLNLVPGRYSIAMRPAGSAPDAAAPLSAGLQIAPGSAQTLLFFDNGSGGSVRGELVDDDLSAPGTSDGKVRLVQGAEGIPPVQALAVDGPRLATDLAYGTVTDYSTVAAKTWDVRLSAGGATEAAQLPVGGGSVNTVVLTKDASGKLAARPLTDVAGLPVSGPQSGAAASGPSGAPANGAGPAAPAPAAPKAPARQIPVGGVPAGGGGTAENDSGPGLLPIVFAVAAAPLLAYSVSSVAAAARRRRG
ncbi:DUF4397 domain-containing protein [Pseudonocardia endophytica]|uniref:Uncharacterized protein DUF4397 n=1 Tax=Pseudonocardia endophytica TaxID=401976 RepID=A0A4R1HMK1_PSEEN|nr:DUF4397 domain-containing protein [Pseudonocardia endophytica]TCK20889.1 uncharacterized protein DUF4397 [Pseudonocardia endophytica]